MGGKLAGLVSAGLGLAMEAASKNGNGKKPESKFYDPARYERSAPRQPRSGVCQEPEPDDYEDNYYRLRQPQVSTARDGSQFEVQNYRGNEIRGLQGRQCGDNETTSFGGGRYGNNDSKRDLSQDNDEEFNIYDPRTPDFPSGNPMYDRQYARSLSTDGPLRMPVIIPQRRPEDRSRGWTRAYAPALLECGIDQQMFIGFIDEFNQSVQESPLLDVINVASIGVGFAPGITPMIVSMAVPIATRAAKQAQTSTQSKSFLDKANSEIFAPRGLYAMVMTYKPEQSSSVITVDTSCPSPQYPARNPSPFQSQDFALPESSPLIFPGSRTAADIHPTNTLMRYREFIGDYNDRRAQAVYMAKNPGPGLVTPPPTFASRWGDPTHPGNSGGLRGLITGVPKDDSEKDLEDQGKKREKEIRKEEKRRRKGRDGGLISTLVQGAMSAADQNGHMSAGGGRPRLVGSVRGMMQQSASGSRGSDQNQNQGLIKTLKNVGKNTDILYLMIVNGPTRRPRARSYQSSSSIRQEPTPQEKFPTPNVVFGKREGDNVRYRMREEDGYNEAERDEDLPPRYTRD